MFLTALLFGAAALLIFLSEPNDLDEKILWGGVIVGFLSIYSAYIGYRLLRNQKAKGYVTLVPIWVIRLMGVVFLFGIGYSVIWEKNYVMLVGGTIGLVSMFLFGDYKERVRKGVEPDSGGNA